MFQFHRSFGARVKRAAAALALASVVLAAAPRADAVVVERIVAIIDDKPILLSELRARGKPFLLQVLQTVPAGAQQAAAQSQVLKDMLEKMVDEELIGQAAARASITVSSQEIDNAFENIAASQGATKEALFKAARAKNGLTEQDYRDEMRRQILEGKMIQLRVKGRVRITEEDMKTMYDRVVREERRLRDYHPAWIVLRLLPGSSAEAIAERKAQAAEIVARARKGEDFAKLATIYSDDSVSKESGGDIGVRTPAASPLAASGKAQMLAPELEAAAMPLEPGEVAAPVQVGQALVIIKLLSRQPSRYTGFKEARPEMIQRLQAEIMDKAKKKWLEELRRRTHVDVRL
jgi:peptidyl-prolyl cis-trans isomerase SurA